MDGMPAKTGSSRRLIYAAAGLVVVSLVVLLPLLGPRLLATDGFEAHGYCFLWQPELLWLFVISDLATGLSYYAISVTLLFWVYRTRRDVPFQGMFVAFGAFIVACGTTHLLDVVTIWNPVYWLSANVRFVTAVASAATAVALPPLVPRALAMVDAAKLSEQRRAHLETANRELESLNARIKELDERRTRFLARVTGTLTEAPLDYLRRSQEAVRLAVSELADWSVLRWLDEAGVSRAMAVAHVDPARETLLQEWQGQSSADADSDGPMREVLRTGTPMVVSDAAEAELAPLAQDDETRRRLAALRMGSYMLMPLMAFGRAHGTLLLAAGDSGRRYTPDDLPLAEEFARRVGVAIDDAWLYHEAQEAVRLREQFLSIASHELRTPVTIVQGYVQGLQRLVNRQIEQHSAPGSKDMPAAIPMDPQRLSHTLLKTAEAVRRLTALIDELLDVTRFLQKRPLEIRVKRTELNQLLTDVLEGVRIRQYSGHYPAGVRVQASLPPVEVAGLWDATRLEQVLFNLLDNAIKYSVEGGRVSVLVDVQDDPSGTAACESVHIRVQDEGIGIPVDQHDRLFQPFVRGSNVSARNYPGLGLGLAISQAIVQRHGGRIWMESAGAGAGSTFHVVLPCVPGEPESE